MNSLDLNYSLMAILKNCRSDNNCYRIFWSVRLSHTKQKGEISIQQTPNPVWYVR